MSNSLVESISSFSIGETQAAIEQTPTAAIPLPVVRGQVAVDGNVIKGGILRPDPDAVAFPTPGSVLLDAQHFGESLWGKTAKLVARLPNGAVENYFLKVVPNLGEVGRQMCEGEFESLTAIDAVSPGFVPKPYAWGELENPKGTYFLLVEFRDIARQPAEPMKLGEQLADMHDRSVSPTGKFGFHIATCHAKIIQAVDQWDDSWCAVFSRHLSRIIELSSPILQWPEFDIVSRLTINKVVPRLLLPLQSDGRVLKPCLVHGDCWDGNTAMDARTGEAFIFDVCSFYGHNEYDIGNWRAPRHRLSDKAYIRNYKRHFPMSEPVGDWDARNLLYSLPYNIGNTIHVPGSSQRQVVYEDMTALCKMFCADDLRREMDILRERKAAEDRAGAASTVGS